MDVLSASSQARDTRAGVCLDVCLEIHLASQAVQLAYDKVQSENVNTANADKLVCAHAYLQLPSSVKRSAKAYNLGMNVRNSFNSPQVPLQFYNTRILRRITGDE